MRFLPTAIPDVIIIEPQVFSDQRGFFMEVFQARKFAEAGLPTHFVQDNHSGSRHGILRGLHYQIVNPQGKLVRAIYGTIFDVAVDIRRSSPTFGKWVGVVLSADNHLQLWIPPGFAHGFYVMSEWAEVHYKTTDFYNPQGERTLRWDDPQLNIEWPLDEGHPPLLSEKDAKGQFLHQAELFD